MNNKIIQGDCLEEMDKLIAEGVIVDCILTDPPFQITACHWDKMIPFAPMWERLNKLIKSNGAIVLFGREPFSSYLRLSNIKNYRYDWIWYKNGGGGFATAKKLPMKRHEVISVFYRKLPTYNPQFQPYSDSTHKRFKEGEMVNRKKQLLKSTNQINNGLSFEGIQGIELKRGKYPESVQFFKVVENANNKRLHPTQKPVALMEYLIKTYTNEGELVLDFTIGSGTTGVACAKLNRNFIGIEKEQKYFEIANRRIENEKNQLKMFVNA